MNKLKNTTGLFPWGLYYVHVKRVTPHNINHLRKTKQMTLAAYHASNRTFGVELEGANISVSEARLAFGANPALAGWRIVSDGTHGVDFEAVSPILHQNEQGFRSVREACDTLNDAGAEVNVKCGLHVHIGVSDLTTSELANVVNRYNYHSQDLDLLVAPSRRKNANHFCRDHESKLQAGEQTPRQLANSQRGRYYKMNLKSYLAHGTIENRHHQGTLNSSKVINWVKLVALQVQLAKDECEGRTETVTAPVAVRRWELGGNQLRIVRYLQNTPGATTAQLMSDLNVTRNVLQSTITRIRRKGYNIRYTSGKYRLVREATTAPVTPSNEPSVGGLWVGVPEELVTYYRRRMTALRTVSNVTASRTRFA